MSLTHLSFSVAAVWLKRASRSAAPEPVSLRTPRPAPLLLRLYNLSLSTNYHVHVPFRVSFVTKFTYLTNILSLFVTPLSPIMNWGLSLLYAHLHSLLTFFIASIIILYCGLKTPFWLEVFVVLWTFVSLFFGHSFLNTEANRQGNLFFMKDYWTHPHPCFKWLSWLTWGYHLIKKQRLLLWFAACATPHSLFALFLFMYSCKVYW